MTKKSALQKARASYQPKLPSALWGAVKAVEGEATQSVANQEEIKALFPTTYGLPVLSFEKNSAAKNQAPINVGVILSGGQAPGGHNVVSGLFDGIKAINKDSRLFGFLMGPGGFVDHKYIELTAEYINDYRNTGGFDNPERTQHLRSRYYRWRRLKHQCRCACRILQSTKRRCSSYRLS